VDPHLQRLQDEIRSITEVLSTEELTWHPPGKWSAGEILEHLYLTYTGTTKGFSRVLASGVLSKRPTFKQRIATMIVVQVGYFPNGAQSPAVARPRGVPSQQVLAEIASKITEMDAIMSNCASKFGPHAKALEHPFLGPFSVAEWRKFHLRHGMHHLKQIQRLRRSMSA
jgi:DinB superfamily